MFSVGAARAVRVKELKSVKAVKMTGEKCILMDELMMVVKVQKAR